MKLIRAYVSKVAANVTSDGLLPWEVFPEKGYFGKSVRAGY